MSISCVLFTLFSTCPKKSTFFFISSLILWLIPVFMSVCLLSVYLSVCLYVCLTLLRPPLVLPPSLSLSISLTLTYFLSLCLSLSLSLSISLSLTLKYLRKKKWQMTSEQIGLRSDRCLEQNDQETRNHTFGQKKYFWAKKQILFGQKTSVKKNYFLGSKNI